MSLTMAVQSQDWAVQSHIYDR